jgi:hypothetical protein
MTASPPPSVPPLVRALLDVREILERARRTDDRREIETAVERINAALDESECRSLHTMARPAHRRIADARP